MTLDAYVAGLIFGYVLVVARIGGALMFMPGFGETQIPPRARLSFALVLCAALYPATPIAAVMPDTPVGMAQLLAYELTIGLWIGLVARVLLSAMDFAGYQVGQVSGLANAFGPSLGSFEGATLVATLMLIGAVAVIFATDTHHVILRGLMMSYTVFPPGPLMLGDLAQQIVRAGARSLYIGTAVAAPFFVMGVILNLGMGLANRMMPQLPVFFVAASVLIAAGMLVLGVAIPSMMDFFISQFTDWFGLLRF
ncbi:flagellar biosynthetic protein FliR [Antarcticimicrobium sediminis]|uniref:Flagellar biosynthetic protein FliR n=1 Tax=Antarcticimicrobium sediminis TaxID=2546227 RepID=A0A4R5EVA5_9RHOB|nr:flagellar biosynthetic protein FliR [Antarcticimicrobium sediminis]TDE38899.1 flagellar biosynthetic protein FliR [Antarcticimicrobium sediminis]